MQVLIDNPLQQTVVFGLLFLLFFVGTLTIKKNYTPLSLTQELKGLAILLILWAHIGYTLSTNPDFLFPFSVLAGVGVNLFLFLSGYGLTISQLKNQQTIPSFYKKRLGKLFIPFWIVLAIFIVLDFLLLGITYSWQFILQSVLGIFTKATMLTDFNSPLWYFSLILFYYILFPIIFSKKFPWVSACILYAILWLVVYSEWKFIDGVIGLYEVHMLAFPLGIIIAHVVESSTAIINYWKKVFLQLSSTHYLVLMASLLVFVSYFSLNANIGKLAIIEEVTSICIMFALIFLFIIKKSESRLLSLFGLFSYEIYLFHWPLLVRYDFLYVTLPAGLATAVYLFIFILLAILLQKVTMYITKK